MRVGKKALRRAWDRAREDAGLDRRDCVVFLVKARMPRGAAEAGYYRPGGPDAPHDQLIPSILRRVPPDILERYENRHRVAIWAAVPRAPFGLLEPLLRHELEHAAQWQRHGRPYSDLDDYVREAWDVRKHADRYLHLPSEREANLAAAAYAHAHLEHEHLRRLHRRRRYRQLVDRAAPALESDSLSLMVAALREARERFLPQCDPEERERELRSLEQHARDWPSDLLEGLRDEEPDDLVVVTHPYKSARAAAAVAEPLGVLAEPE
jgi:hypothetical protein